MMQAHRKQVGFTLIEIVIALAISAILVLMMLPNIMSQMESAKIDAAIGQAKNILQVCEIARRKVTSSSTAANLKVTHTYNSLAAWSSTATLQSQLGQDYNLPDTNAFGKAILVRYDAARCYVAVDLDFIQNNVAGYPTSTVGGVTRVTLSSRPKIGTDTNWVSHQKRILHDETTR